MYADQLCLLAVNIRCGSRAIVSNIGTYDVNQTDQALSYLQILSLEHISMVCECPTYTQVYTISMSTWIFERGVKKQANNFFSWPKFQYATNIAIFYLFTDK
jgi:hypothetical protein